MKALRHDDSWCVLGRTRGPVWLEWKVEGRVAQSKVEWRVEWGKIMFVEAITGLWLLLCTKLSYFEWEKKKLRVSPTAALRL